MERSEIHREDRFGDIEVPDNLCTGPGPRPVVTPAALACRDIAKAGMVQYLCFVGTSDTLTGGESGPAEGVYGKCPGRL